MAIVAVEPAIENMLEEAGALPRHYRIALNRLKVAIGAVTEEDLDLPPALGVISVAVRIDFGPQIGSSAAFPFGVVRLFKIKKCGSRHGGIRFQQHFFGGLIQVQDRIGALADDLEVVTVVASIKCEIEAPGARIAKQIRLLVALLTHPTHQHSFFLHLNSLP